MVPVLSKGVGPSEKDGIPSVMDGPSTMEGLAGLIGRPVALTGRSVIYGVF